MTCFCHKSFASSLKKCQHHKNNCLVHMLWRKTKSFGLSQMQKSSLTMLLIYTTFIQALLPAFHKNCCALPGLIKTSSLQLPQIQIRTNERSLSGLHPRSNQIESWSLHKSIKQDKYVIFPLPPHAENCKSSSFTHKDKPEPMQHMLILFFNVSQWARNILDEIFSKEYIQLPSTINLTRTTRFCDKSFFKSLKFHVVVCMLVSM